jgi:4-alpha-glucanotransferase
MIGKPSPPPGYRWCIDRLKSLLAHVDLIRLDHFVHFARLARSRRRLKPLNPDIGSPGPGAAFFAAVRSQLGHLPFIAEDLGIITPDVVALRDQFEVPGIRVFQFGFDGNSDNPHLPTLTARTPLPIRERTTITPLGVGSNLCRSMFARPPGVMRERPGAGTGEVAWDFIRSVWSSKAGLAIAPLQDLLNLGVEGRMNVPGVAAGNWRWRCTEEMLTPLLFDRLRELTISAGRMSQSRPSPNP